MLKEIHLELNHLCNLNCLMCEHKFLSQKEYLKKKDLNNIFKSNSFLNAQTISLSGGEPTLSKNFLYASLKILKAKKRLIILSNLLNIKKIIILLNSISKDELKLIHIGSSIDGDKKTHNLIRNKKNAYNTLLNNLYFLREKFNVSLSLTFTVLNLNFMYLPFVFKEFKDKLFIPIFVQNLIKDDKNKYLSLNKKEIKNFRNILKKLSKKYKEIKYLIDFKNDRKFCLAGKKFLFVSPEGNVYICPKEKNIIAGNIKKEKFDKITNRAKFLINKINPENCKDCSLICKK